MVENPTYKDLQEQVRQLKQENARLKQNAQHQAASKEKYRKIVDNALAGIFIVQDGRFVYINSRMAEIHGYDDVSAIIGRNFWEIVHPDDRYWVKARGLRRERGETEPGQYEFRAVKPEGTTLWVEIRARRSEYSGRPAIQGNIIDITQRRWAEDQLRALNIGLEKRVAERTIELEKRAEQLQRLAMELSQAEDNEQQKVAQILHDDLQQILVSARMQLDVLDGSMSPSYMNEVLEKVREFLQAGLEKTRNLSHDLSPPVLSHSGLADALEWLARRMQENYGLSVRTDLKSRIRPKSKIIERFVYRAVQELLFNVVKHAGVDEATVRLRKTKTGFHILIADRGTGLSASQTGKLHGGFGIFSIRERIDLLGGRLRIRSIPGKGTAVGIFIPDEEAIAHGNAKGCNGNMCQFPDKTHRVNNAAHLPDQPIRILLADDHRVFRKGLSRLLSAQPDFLIIGEAGDGKEALDLALTLQPDVVIMDVAMPIIDGTAATSQIKSHLPDTRIIGLSIFNTDELKKAMVKAGADTLFSKSCEPDPLIEAIRQPALSSELNCRQ